MSHDFKEKVTKSDYLNYPCQLHVVWVR